MDRSSDSKKTLNSAFLYSIANVVSVIVSFISIPILTNLMSTSDMGIAVSFNTLKTILAYILLLALYSTIDRAILDYKEKTDEYISSIYIFSSITALFFYSIYLLFQKFLNPIFGFNTKMMSLMFLIIMLQNAFTLTTTYWNFKNVNVKNFIVNLFNSPVAQILSIALVYFMASEKYLGRIAGIEFFSTITGLVMGIIILKKGRFKFKKKYIKYALLISIPIIPHLVSQTILSQSDLLMIKHYLGASEAGIYSLAYSISTILYTVLLQIMRPWSSWVYRRIELDEVDSIKTHSKNLIIFGWIMAIGLLMVNKEIILWFLNKSYANAIYVVLPMITGVFFQFIYMFYYDIQYYYKKSKRIMYASLGAAIINIILNVICIPRFGYIAAGYTTMVSYMLLSFFHYYSTKAFNKRNLYDNKIILILCLLLVGYMFLTLVFIEHVIIKYIIGIILILTILLKNKEGFIQILNTILKRGEGLAK